MRSYFALIIRRAASRERQGVDSSVIPLWLRHESVETTQVYIEADLALKEKALAKVAPLAKRKSLRHGYLSVSFGIVGDSA